MSAAISDALVLFGAMGASVARMKRSGIRDDHSVESPDYAMLHPGYGAVGLE